MLTIAQCNKTVDTSCLLVGGQYASYARPVSAHFIEFFFVKTYE